MLVDSVYLLNEQIDDFTKSIRYMLTYLRAWKTTGT